MLEKPPFCDKLVIDCGVLSRAVFFYVSIVCSFKHVEPEIMRAMTALILYGKVLRAISFLFLLCLLEEVGITNCH